MRKTILFLPFLRIPSGHHHVADALIDKIRQMNPQIGCEKVDILSYSYGKFESLVARFYLKWIKTFPVMYSSIYKRSVCRNMEQSKRYRLYEFLFIYFMKRLMKEKEPSIIVCTHALPSYMLNLLKEKKKVTVPVINVYTDYFIHRFWGVDHIDFHFVPSYRMKEFLLQKGISDKRIFITGIPVHSSIKKTEKQPLNLSKKSATSVLISGGNLGVGAIEDLIQKIAHPTSPYFFHFYVLCGKNKKLYEKLKKMDKPHIVPLPYIDCKEKMNRIYEKIDIILTKPGGVTISESLFKRKPIFIFDALPGQEEINLQELRDQELVFFVESEDVCGQLLATLQNEFELKRYYERVEDFHSHFHCEDPAELIMELIN